jgi:hypothetical protein
MRIAKKKKRCMGCWFIPLNAQQPQLYACITNIRITPDEKNGVEKWTHMIKVEKCADLLEPHELVEHVTKGSLGRKIRRCDDSTCHALPASASAAAPATASQDRVAVKKRIVRSLSRSERTRFCCMAVRALKDMSMFRTNLTVSQTKLTRFARWMSSLLPVRYLQCVFLDAELLHEDREVSLVLTQGHRAEHVRECCLHRNHSGNAAGTEQYVVVEVRTEFRRDAPRL